MNPLAFPIQILLVVAACVVGVWFLIKALAGLGWAIGRVFSFIATVLGRIGSFIKGMASDTLRVIGGGLTAVFFVPFIVSNIALGRWSRANHYGKAFEREAVGVGTSLYRLVIGHVGRLLGLTSLTDGIERRIPEAMARAPGPDTPRGRPDAFEGYTVVGSLPSGGSGAKLYLAKPLPDKLTQLQRGGRVVAEKVVIKSFSLADGSTMPQIVRESRALEAARNMGLVLEHELGATRFHYVMPYVPGDDLTLVTQQLHDKSGAEGLKGRQLGLAIEYIADLLQTVQRFHSAGLWHKDIKPSNIIVSSGRVHLVDLGLTTPLHSAMTLTTHGTEYFRDPELVRLALRGVKVQEVDGVKFDIYGTGAVLFSMLENGFPAHGSLSQIHKACPEALRWIVRRAMADMNKRYASATEMLADLRVVMNASDPYSVTPAALPSVSGRGYVPEDIPAAATLAYQADFAHEVPGIPRDRASIAATQRGGGMRWGSVAALVCVGVLGLAFVGSLVMGVRNHRWSADAISTPTGGDWQEPVPLPIEPASTRAASSSSGRTPSPTLASVLGKHRQEASVILVLDDVGSAATQAADARLTALYASLETANFEVAGIGRTQHLSPDQETSLLGSIRLLIGQSSSWDEGLRVQIGQWIGKQAPTLGAVMHLSRGSSPEQVLCQFVTLDEVDDKDLRKLLGIQGGQSGSSKPTVKSGEFRYDIF